MNIIIKVHKLCCSSIIIVFHNQLIADTYINHVMVITVLSDKLASVSAFIEFIYRKG